MYADFRKPAAEVDGIEIFNVLSEIKHALTHLHQWTRPKKVDAPFTMLGTRSRVLYEPRGICLIISPWNYPFGLCVGPLVAALAAGNAAIVKPSEMTPHVAALVSEMCRDIFPDGVVAAFEGGPECSQQLLALPFDHIFFTGSPGVGKIVMAAAAKNLTSVTLELGGKCPAIVTRSAHLSDAARRIAVSKFVNNGQTCVAPDYILVEKSLAEPFLQKLKEETLSRFGNGKPIAESHSYCRMVNDNHYHRVLGLLNDALERGGRTVLTGEHREEERFIHPTIIADVPEDASVNEEEIFGPVLPVLTFESLDEAIQTVNRKPKPLSLYLFSNQSAEIDKVMKETSAGTCCVNEAAIHFLHSNLPFGGVNNSGIGKSHGYHGFLAFSNEKPVLKQKRGFTSIQVFYPPYTPLKKRIMDWFLKLF